MKKAAAKQRATTDAQPIDTRTAALSEREKQIVFAFLHKMEKRLAVLEKRNIVPFHEPLELQALAGLDALARPGKPRGNGRALAA